MTFSRGFLSNLFDYKSNDFAAFPYILEEKEMFKLLIALVVVFAVQAQIPGGFTNRPDLLRDPATETMVKLAVNELATGQNLRTAPINVVSVATQVVNGVNYLIVFNVRSLTNNSILQCTTKIYKSFAGAQSVSSVNCA